MQKGLLKFAAFVPMFFMGTNADAIDIVDGVYQIGTPKDLTEFAEIVNRGESAVNAVLTADIDMDGAKWAHPISGISESMGGARSYVVNP